MGNESSFEDITRAIARRRLIIAVTVIVFAALGAVYGWRTTSHGDFEAEALINIVQSNVVLAESQQQPLPLNASLEASRLQTRLSRLTNGNEDLVSARSVNDINAISVTATGASAAAAEGLALTTARQYVDERRAEEGLRYAGDAEFQASQLAATSARIDEVNASLAALDPDQSSFALEGERVQLFDRLLRITERLDASTLNAEQYDAGLAEPVLADDAVTTSSSGWVVFALVGATLGAMIGIGLALIANALDHRLRTRADLERVIPGARVLGVLGKGSVGTTDIDELIARIRAIAGPDGAVVLLTVPGAPVPGAIAERLRDHGQVVVLDRATDVGSERVVLAVRAGVTTDADLVGVVADLDVRGIPVAGVVLWDVPKREDEWARRPLLTTRADGASF